MATERRREGVVTGTGGPGRGGTEGPGPWPAGPGSAWTRCGCPGCPGRCRGSRGRAAEPLLPRGRGGGSGGRHGGTPRLPILGTTRVSPRHTCAAQAPRPGPLRGARAVPPRDTASCRGQRGGGRAQPYGSPRGSCDPTCPHHGPGGAGGTQQGQRGQSLMLRTPDPSRAPSWRAHRGSGGSHQCGAVTAVGTHPCGWQRQRVPDIPVSPVADTHSEWLGVPQTVTPMYQGAPVSPSCCNTPSL